MRDLAAAIGAAGLLLGVAVDSLFFVVVPVAMCAVLYYGLRDRD